jgi:hypothetical protein
MKEEGGFRLVVWREEVTEFRSEKESGGSSRSEVVKERLVQASDEQVEL